MFHSVYETRAWMTRPSPIVQQHHSDDDDDGDDDDRLILKYGWTKGSVLVCVCVCVRNKLILGNVRAYPRVWLLWRISSVVCYNIVNQI